ncbi:type VII secretion protein EccE [Tomitella fengzijianii]|uniref:Type VII secretion system protein EccE domain-containing protein n=1 Tax=Tomitella fengzijianii TaxID=2597660 RepID=A0A516X5Q7_9ACTN|nr:type VII secretion protein EccE [Tomitella fengzijianii]QDQ98353.1 hypothetical protein FO059_14805 [Tomitella fengzijianii]
MGTRPVAIVIAAEIVGITAALALLVVGSGIPAAAAAGILTGLGAVVPVRGRSLVDGAALRYRHLLQSRGLLAAVPPGPAMTSGGNGRGAAGRRKSAPSPAAPTGVTRRLAVPPETGFRWDAEELVCAMQVSEQFVGITTISSGRSPQSRGGAAAALSPGLLAPLLDQFDVRLSGIDIHTRSIRTAGPPAAAAVHSRLVGQLPAAVRHDTVVMVRLDPRLCPEAVARRGGAGPGARERGAVRAAGVAAARIVRAIEREGMAATMLTAADLDGAVRGFIGDHGAGGARVRWDRIDTGTASDAGRRTHTTFALPTDAAAVGAHPWACAWDQPCATAVMSVRLGRPRSPGHVRVGALARYASDAPVPAPRVPGARLLRGAQADALQATSPRGDSRFDRLAEPADIPPAAAGRLTIPVAGHGQLIGGDASGKAVLARLVGPPLRTVEVAGQAYIARQVVLRALATGARILVITDRPGEWRHLEAEIADVSSLRVAAAVSTFSGVTTPPTSALSDATVRRYGAVVVDCLGSSVPVPRVPADATVIRVVQRGAAGAGHADARVHQDPDDPNAVHVVVHGAAATVSVVSIPDEARLIGRPE